MFNVIHTTTDTTTQKTVIDFLRLTREQLEFGRMIQKLAEDAGKNAAIDRSMGDPNYKTAAQNEMLDTFLRLSNEVARLGMSVHSIRDAYREIARDSFIRNCKRFPVKSH